MRPFAILLALAAAGCARGSAVTEVRFETGTGSFAVRAEVADSTTERARGLMFREELADDAGMLFVWDDVDRRDFHMLNTLIPLDLISIRAGRVVGVHRMVPCDEPSTCEGTAATTPPADAALEVNAGTADRAGIEPGTLVDSSALR